ncbi:MAG: sigma-70 family RNA polymerase sigma factor [Clostridia bacterium]|nr:sigma-70 family RNA polymerase sigma factor [Clostridia bacterium]
MSIRSERKRSKDISFNNPIGADMDGNEISIGELIGTDPDGVFNAVVDNLEARALHKLMAEQLNEREQTVLTLRYGLLGGVPMPQREVAELMGISRSYVSRIETKAILKLQKSVKGPLPL